MLLGNVRFQPIKHQFFHQIETSQLICYGNQLSGFNMRVIFIINDLNMLQLSSQRFSLRYFRAFMETIIKICPIKQPFLH